MEQTINYKGYTIEIKSDNDPTNPREWSNLGTMVCFHSRYNLGDDHNYGKSSDAVDEFLAELAGVDDYLNLPQNDQGKGITNYLLKKAEEKNLILPLYLYDHSGITMNTTGFSCGWDSGQVGFIYVSLEKVREEYGWKHITKKRREKILEYLTGEVETYDQFLTGDVYGFKVLDNEENELDSCWGFYGDLGVKDAISEGKSHIDWYIKEKVKNHIQQVKEWILNKVPFIYRKPLQLA